MAGITPPTDLHESEPRPVPLTFGGAGQLKYLPPFPEPKRAARKSSRSPTRRRSGKSPSGYPK